MLSARDREYELNLTLQTPVWRPYNADHVRMTRVYRMNNYTVYVMSILNA